MEIYYVEGYDKYGNIASPIVFRASDAKAADTIETLLGLLSDADILEGWEKRELKSI